MVKNQGKGRFVANGEKKSGIKTRKVKTYGRDSKYSACDWSREWVDEGWKLR